MIHQEDLLSLVKENARRSSKDIATALNASPKDVEETLSHLEKQNIIVKYTAIVNESAIEKNQKVKALIELNVRPEKEYGYTKIAKKLQTFPHITDVVLVAGRFDFLLTVEANSLQEISDIVTAIASMKDVLQTATHFILRPYKISGVAVSTEDHSERLQISL